MREAFQLTRIAMALLSIFGAYWIPRLLGKPIEWLPMAILGVLFFVQLLRVSWKMLCERDAVIARHATAEDEFSKHENELKKLAKLHAVGCEIRDRGQPPTDRWNIEAPYLPRDHKSWVASLRPILTPNEFATLDDAAGNLLSLNVWRYVQDAVRRQLVVLTEIRNERERVIRQAKNAMLIQPTKSH
jgi:hypothetical protein